MAFPSEKYSSAKPSSPKSDTVRFEFNLPQLVCLKYAQPKKFTNQWGERAMYSLTDGRVMFVDPAAADAIEALGVEAGEPIYIAKRRDRDHGPNPYWDIWREPAVKKAPASELESQLQDSLAYQANGAAENPSVDAQVPVPVAVTIPRSQSQWAERVRRETQTKLTLYHEICGWAKGNLEGITRNEVRAILMNVMISAERSR